MSEIVEKVQTVLPDLTKTATQVTTVPVIENGAPKPFENKPRPTPILENPYSDDVAFARLLELYLPADVKKRADGELNGVAEAAVSDKAMNWVADTERNPPTVQRWDSWGANKDELVTSQGWKELWRWGKEERYVAR
jgi:hypothetical protein